MAFTNVCTRYRPLGFIRLGRLRQPMRASPISDDASGIGRHQNRNAHIPGSSDFALKH